MTTQVPPLSKYVAAPPPNAAYLFWLTFTLCDWPCPGTIAPGGVRGFRRKYGWDVQNGKGDAGGVLVLVKQPPAKGSFVMQLLTQGDLAAWDQFYASILSTPPNLAKRYGLPLFYPGLTNLAINNVVIEDVSPLEYVRGKLTVEISMLEWLPPPAQSIVATPATTAPDQGPSTNAPPPQNPILAQKQAQLAALQGAASAANTLGPAAGGSST
jgi:hypothetical protein